MPTAVVFQNIPHEGLGTVADAAARAGWRLDLRNLNRGDPVPDAPRDTDAVIVMGGPMNVNDMHEFPFLDVECRFLREALQHQVPLLGFCLGSQLIAKAAGSVVTPAPRKEIGWYDVELTPAAMHDALFQGCPPRLGVFHWHGDTFDLPPGATLLCTHDVVPHQAFRLGLSTYAFQFHIEMTAAMIEDWIARNGEELAGVRSYIDPAAILAAIPSRLPAMQAVAATVFDRWFALLDGNVGA